MAGDPNPTAPSRSAELSGETTVPANHASGGSDAREPEGAIPEEAMTGEAMPGEAMAREATAGEATAGEAMTETEMRSEEHTSELQSLMRISYAVFCLNKKHTHRTEDSYYEYTD